MALTKIPANLLDKSAHVDFADNEQLRIGTGNDLVLKHTGSNTVIHNTTGQFRIRANDLSIQSYNNEEKYIEAGENGSVDLYYDNSKKFETSSTGATVTGNLAVTGDLDITGNVNSASVTDLDVTDKTITLGVGQTEAQSGGSGIVIDGSAASFTWDETNDRWLANKKIACLEDVIVNANAGQDSNIEVGAGTSQNHYSYIDLIGDTTYTDYGLRLIRNNGGANTTAGIHHRGTGNLFFRTDDAANIIFSTNMNGGGAERMRISSGGNVGIGTGSPTAALSVISGSSEFSAQISRYNADDGLFLHSAAQSSHYNWLIANQENVNKGLEITPSASTGARDFNTPAFVILADTGNVGIGTSSPSELLHVKGTNGAIAIDGNGSSNTASIKFINDNERSRITSAYGSGGGGVLTFHTDTTGGSLLERMRIDASGRVGIGTTALYNPLTVSGADSVAIDDYIIHNGDSNTKFGFSADDTIDFRTGGDVRLRIDSNGNLLVGATSFQNGAFGGNSRGINVAGIQPIVLLHETDTDKDAYLGISGSNLFLGTADDIGIRFHTNDTERMRLLGNGNFGIGTTSPGTSLQIGNGTGDEYITIDKSTTGASGILFKNAGNNKVKLLCNSAEEFELHVNNALKMYVNEDGDVGISTSTPHGRLHVYSANANEAQVYQTTTCKEYRNVCTSYTTSNTNRYWHIKTNIATSNNVMFVGHVEGYAYGASGHIVDVKRSGYMYAASSAVINSQTVNNGSGSATLNTYNSSDGYLVFVCDFGGAYYSGGAFHIQFPAPAGYTTNFSIQAHDMNNTSTGHY